MLFPAFYNGELVITLSLAGFIGARPAKGKECQINMANLCVVLLDNAAYLFQASMT